MDDWDLEWFDMDTLYTVLALTAVGCGLFVWWAVKSSRDIKW